ncbi:MAG: hypothetical protein ABJF23_21220 [Bryobacteraceae bacterium]
MHSNELLEPLGHVLESDIARTKSEFDHMAETIRTRYAGDDQVIHRVEQVQAAMLRLAWALERTLDTPGSSFNRAE